MARAILALLAAALAYPSSVLALGLHKSLGGALQVGVVLFFCVLGMGLPALVAFCKLKWWGFWRLVAGGTLGGALCALPFVGSAQVHLLFLVVIFALAGTVSAVLFWVAAIWRNNNLTCPKEFRLPGGAVYRFAYDALRRQGR